MERKSSHGKRKRNTNVCVSVQVDLDVMCRENNTAAAARASQERKENASGLSKSRELTEAQGNFDQNTLALVCSRWLLLLLVALASPVFFNFHTNTRMKGQFTFSTLHTTASSS